MIRIPETSLAIGWSAVLLRSTEHLLLRFWGAAVGSLWWLFYPFPLLGYLAMSRVNAWRLFTSRITSPRDCPLYGWNFHESRSTYVVRKSISFYTMYSKIILIHYIFWQSRQICGILEPLKGGGNTRRLGFTSRDFMHVILLPNPWEFFPVLCHTSWCRWCSPSQKRWTHRPATFQNLCCSSGGGSSADRKGSSLEGSQSRKVPARLATRKSSWQTSDRSCCCGHHYHGSRYFSRRRHGYSFEQGLGSLGWQRGETTSYIING